MPNSQFPTNFQHNIFIFQAKAGLWILLQWLKQKGTKSVQLGNAPKYFSITFEKYYIPYYLFLQLCPLGLFHVPQKLHT